MTLFMWMYRQRIGCHRSAPTMYENDTNFKDRLQSSGLGGALCCCCCCCWCCCCCCCCRCCSCTCDCDCGCSGRCGCWCGCWCGCGCGGGTWGRDEGGTLSGLSGLSGRSGRSDLSGLSGIEVGPDEKRGWDERTLTRRPMSVWLGFITRVLKSDSVILDTYCMHIFWFQADILW